MFFVSVRRDYSLHIRFPYNPFDLFGIKDGKIFNTVAAKVATEDEIPRLQCTFVLSFKFQSQLNYFPQLRFNLSLVYQIQVKPFQKTPLQTTAMNTSLRNSKDALRIVMDKISAKMFGLILPQVIDYTRFIHFKNLPLIMLPFYYLY